MDVFGVERCNERLIETGEDVVDDFVALVFELLNSDCGAGQVRVSVLRRFHQ